MQYIGSQHTVRDSARTTHPAPVPAEIVTFAGYLFGQIFDSSPGMARAGRIINFPPRPENRALFTTKKRRSNRAFRSLRMDPMVATHPLFLGCPVWACDHWRGSLYTPKAPRADWLKQYSSVFGTVEGNSTFYALPSLETAQRWADSVARGFQFSLKMPRSISHDKRLRDAEKELKAFLEVADILDVARCLGPSFLQLPPDFSPDSRSILEKFLRELPTYLPWALEVRHFDWYDAGPVERWLDDLLTELRIDKVLFDSRPLYSKPPADDIEKASQSRKPKTPIRQTVTGEHPFLRIVGRNNLDDVTPWIEEWAPVIAGWIAKGLTPFVFTHAPDDKFAPEFARRMHAAVKKLLPSLPEMSGWPGEAVAQDARKQRTLF